MRASFTGKGGSGKTTVASLFSRYLAHQKLSVMAVDGDINQHFAQALGFSDSEIEKLPKLGNEITFLKDYLRGNNPLIKSAEEMIGTTPPGQGSRILRFNENNPLFNRFELRKGGIRFMAVGGFANEGELGTTCFHTYTGAMELVLNHLIDEKGEYFIADMTAGADPLASGLFTRFDVMFLVVEPTMKSLAVFEQCKEYSEPFGIPFKVIGNKIEDDGDIEFIKERVGDFLLGTVTHSKFVRDLEKGRFHPITELEPENLALLEKIKQTIDETHRDWERYTKLGHEFHKRKAEHWANAMLGVDVTKQIDEKFSYLKNYNGCCGGYDCKHQ